ncbi:MAG: SDR family oxidoreductase [Planctomycetes bacterium]|nr:SDR family oxidoreductase [Planctomycetota bacterium]
MSERIVLVTGGVRGLGLAVARRFAADGDRVHLVYRSSQELAREREAEFGGRVHRADLTDEADVAELFRTLIEREGRLDVLVHAVGEYTTGSLAETTIDDWRRMLASNLESTILVTDAARPHLRAARGVWLGFGVSGLDGLRARTRTAAYAAAKSALLVYARSLAREEAPFGVRANLISPGVVPHAHAADDAHDPRILASIPFGRVGTPEEVAEAAHYLCSPAASYVTGVDLAVAGGFGD